MLKVNVLFAAALAALGGVVAAGVPAVPESLCDNYDVSSIEIAQVSRVGQLVEVHDRFVILLQ